MVKSFVEIGMRELSFCQNLGSSWMWNFRLFVKSSVSHVTSDTFAEYFIELIVQVDFTKPFIPSKSILMKCSLEEAILFHACSS